MFAVVRVLVSLLGSEVFVKDTREGNRKYFCCLDAEAPVSIGICYLPALCWPRGDFWLISFTQLFFYDALKVPKAQNLVLHAETSSDSVVIWFRLEISPAIPTHSRLHIAVKTVYLPLWAQLQFLLSWEMSGYVTSHLQHLCCVMGRAFLGDSPANRRGHTCGVFGGCFLNTGQTCKCTSSWF